MLNSILSLPNLFVSLHNDGLVPVADVFRPSQSFHFLEIQFELTLLLALWAMLSNRWARRTRIWLWRGFVAFLCFSLIYQSYASTMTGLYKLEPNFYNDYAFISGGLAFFLNALDFPKRYYAAFGIVIAGVFLLVGWSTRAVMVNRPDAKVGWGSRAVFAALCLWSGLALHKADASYLPVNSLSIALAQNVQRSQATRQDVKKLGTLNPYQTYNYAQYTLREKPDIYLIFIESYGHVLYSREHFLQPYTEIMTEFESQLAATGWQAVSTISEAPTWGGGSWISYTNALFGVNISEQRQYEALKSAYQVIPYPNLGRYLHTQGYEYIWVSPIQLPLSADRARADRNFFGADRWITYEDLGYTGPVYGWGPAPSDQFSLGFMHQIAQQSEKPAFFVYLTQNSHYPYKPLPPVLEDWQEFETLPVDERANEPADRVFRETRKNYIAAIDYTIEVLARFISALSDSNTIVILIGDHQPPGVSYKGDGFAVPVHIIGRDADFAREFESDGFEAGLLLSDWQPAIKQAGFYSLFVQNLVASYGHQPEQLPPYLPNGLGE